MSICDLIHGVIYGLYIGEGRLLDSYTLWQVHCIKFRNRGGCVPACLPSYIYFIDKKKRKKKKPKVSLVVENMFVALIFLYISKE
jgi:hypothetical protein